MLTNNNVTIYHKTLDNDTKLEKWTRKVYKNVWVFGGKGAGVNKGYQDANDVDVRIFYRNNKIDMNNINIEDIIAVGDIDKEITTQQDLDKYETYNVTSINNNNFGSNPHVHLGGK